MINANNPSLKSWVEIPALSDFPIQNLPFGIFRPVTSGSDFLIVTPSRAGVRIGDHVLDLAAVSSLGYFNDLDFDKNVFEKACLNDFIACGQTIWRAVRERVSELLREDSKYDLKHINQVKVRPDDEGVLFPIAQVEMQIPVKIGDYTDFYSSIEHATNVGSMFRDPANALLPNWKHIPVGYHGRASSIFVSGTDFHRPKGQTKAPDAEVPSFGATKQLDFELEVAFIVGKNNRLGESISTGQAEEHIFGFVLFNDWSARDIQSWEYVPLGPFLGKNFFSSMSSWIVTLDALEPFRVETPEQNPPVLPYLQFEGKKNFDINLEVAIQPENAIETIVSKSNFKYMYWNVNQQLAHHTINGCNTQIGDLYASGTISGKDRTSFGSMLELSWRGTQPLKMTDGTERKFINDYDTVIMRGYGEKNGVRIGFGEVAAKVLPTIN